MDLKTIRVKYLQMLVSKIKELANHIFVLTYSKEAEDAVTLACDKLGQLIKEVEG